MRVEGMPRHASTHAAGVVISREPLTSMSPFRKVRAQTALTQYTMEHLEAIGLLKMDFLGLRTLSIIERTVDWIAPDGKCASDLIGWTWMRMPMTYGMLSRGNDRRLPIGVTRCAQGAEGFEAFCV